MRKFGAGFLALFVGLVLGACGSSPSSPGDGTGARSTTSGYTRTAADAPKDPTDVAQPDEWGPMKRKAGPYAKRLLIPDGPPPKRVVIRDLRPGDGREIQHNDSFQARYTSYFFSSGILAEEAWSKNPGSLIWDIEQVVDGWWPGLKGMREGGLRELIVPSSWAYGNGARVYLVELVHAEPQ
jgi:peptidylprolyl isomerase